MRRALAVALALLATAGCLGTDQASSPDSPGPTSPSGPATVAFDATNVSDQWPSAEPVVDVASDGTIFLQGVGSTAELTLRDTVLPRNYNFVWRSTDGGETWTDVSPPGRGGNQSCDAFVAVGPDDTVYAANCHMPVGFGLGASEMALFRSDDLGDAWEPLVPPPVPTPMHRMWLVPGPQGVLHVAVEGLYPNVGLYYLRSDDRGESWDAPVPVDLENGYGSDVAVDHDAGVLYAVRINQRVEPDGTVHHPGPFYLMVSENAGQTWEKRPVFALEGRLTTGWQSLEVAPDGTLHLVWAEADDGTSRIHHAFTTDRGQRWTGPRTLGESQASRTMVWSAADPEGGLALSWYEADQPGLPDDLDARWYAHHGRVTNATDPDPILETTRVASWPLHQGSICTELPRCTNGADRTLLDYTWTALGPDGRVHLAFASSQWDRPDAFPVHAVERPAGP